MRHRITSRIWHAQKALDKLKENPDADKDKITRATTNIAGLRKQLMQWGGEGRAKGEEKSVDEICEKPATKAKAKAKRKESIDALDAELEESPGDDENEQTTTKKKGKRPSAYT